LHWSLHAEIDGSLLAEKSEVRYAQAGQLRGVLVTSRERSKLMLPTIFESLQMDKSTSVGSISARIYPIRWQSLKGSSSPLYLENRLSGPFPRE
jgi:hypothetical protein